MKPPRAARDASSPQLHATQGRLILLLLERAGVAVDEALAETGFSAADLLAATRQVPFQVLRRLVLALPPDRRAGFGLALGELSPPTAHGPLAAAMAASATLHEALESLAEFGGVRGDMGRFRYGLSRDFGEIEYLEVFDYGDMREMALESAALYVSKMMAAVVGRALVGTRFAFPYPPPDWAGRYAEHFPGVVEFGGPALLIRIPRAELSTRCVAADLAVREAALRECRREAAEAETASEPDIAALVKRRLAEAGDAYPSLEAMAASLAISPRTLIRRLRASGLRYRALIDQARAVRACWRLAHTQDTMDQIAADLGYLDSSNFSRTFRRWRGETPTQFRARQEPPTRGRV